MFYIIMTRNLEMLILTDNLTVSTEQHITGILLSTVVTPAYLHAS